MIFTVSISGQVTADTPEEAARKFDESLKPHYVVNTYHVTRGREGTVFVRVERGEAKRTA